MDTQAPAELEVWKNVAKGMRWITRFDRQGREADTKIQGGRTFTLTPFERQINQEKAATAELDAFRNGTFVLVRKAESASEEEILSPSARTNQEIEELAQRVIASPEEADGIIAELSSPVSLDRLYEFLVAYDAGEELLSKTKEAIYKADGGTVPVRRRMVGGDQAVVTAGDTAE